MSMHALIGAYQEEGYEWLEELRSDLRRTQTMRDFIHREFDGVEVTKPEGTYMLFLSTVRSSWKHNLTLDSLENGWNVGVAWQDGKMFFGEGCIRGQSRTYSVLLKHLTCMKNIMCLHTQPPLD